MSQSTYCIRGRQIGPDELTTIRQFSEAYWSQGRSAISRALCEHWDWRQADGRLKDRSCRVMLLELAARGEIELPPRKKYNNRGEKPPAAIDLPLATEVLTGSVFHVGSLTIDMVGGSAREKLWDHLVYTHHYLGFPWIVGAYLKYLAYLDGRLVACLGWGSAAWRVACRDAFIGWDRARRQGNLSLVVNNVRFLILPWCRWSTWLTRCWPPMSGVWRRTGRRTIASPLSCWKPLWTRPASGDLLSGGELALCGHYPGHRQARQPSLSPRSV